MCGVRCNLDPKQARSPLPRLSTKIRTMFGRSFVASSAIAVPERAAMHRAAAASPSGKQKACKQLRHRIGELTGLICPLMAVDTDGMEPPTQGQSENQREARKSNDLSSHTLASGCAFATVRQGLHHRSNYSRCPTVDNYPDVATHARNRCMTGENALFGSTSRTRWNIAHTASLLTRDRDQPAGAMARPRTARPVVSRQRRRRAKARSASDELPSTISGLLSP